MQIKFLGAVESAGEVTGSRTLLTLPDGTNILIDFGMVQGHAGNLEETMKWNGRDFEFNIEDIDYLICTHAHFDHIGSIPLLIKRGFKGKIISTAPTADFCAISFPDSAKVMQSDCDFVNRRRPKNKIEPLYTKEEGIEAAKSIQCYGFNTKIRLNDNASVSLLPNGHMLGSCMPKITYHKGKNKQTILFTGDSSAKNSSHPFIKVADDIGSVDYIVCESTYGNRVHNRTENPIDKLAQAALDTCIMNDRVLVLPVFSLQRSSEVLWLLREAYIKNPRLYKIPIYLDTPMGIKAQLVMDENRDYWGSDWVKRDEELTSLFKWEALQYVDDFQQSQALNNKDPKIILASSGMCTGGRILDHLQSFLPIKNCKVIFTGYQVEHGLGRKLLSGEQKFIAINRNQVIIRADIDSINLSSHADKNEITEWLKSSKKGKLKKILLNHGDVSAIDGLHKELKQHFKGVQIIKPKYNENIGLK